MAKKYKINKIYYKNSKNFCLSIGVGAFFGKYITKYDFWSINSEFRSFIYILF